MEFGHIDTQSASDKFIGQIQDMIISGKLKVGDRLPTERELAASTGISKSLVHICVKELERMGFVKVTPYHGITVANYAETGNIDALMVLLRYNGGVFDELTVRSLMEVRELLEGYSLRKMAREHDPEVALRLKMYASDLLEVSKREPAAGMDELIWYAYESHDYIYRRSGNNIIPLIMNAFKGVTLEFWRRWIEAVGAQTTAEYIKRLAECIERGDEEGAAAYDREGTAEFIRHYPASRES